jgi:hypothetical protein
MNNYFLFFRFLMELYLVFQINLYFVLELFVLLDRLLRTLLYIFDYGFKFVGDTFCLQKFMNKAIF